MQNHKPQNSVVPTRASPDPMAKENTFRWSDVVRKGLSFGVLLVFASYVMNLIIWPLLTGRAIEDFIESPYRALQKMVTSFAFGITCAIIKASKQVTAKNAPSVVQSHERQQ
jgi:hypothetical protein